MVSLFYKQGNLNPERLGSCLEPSPILMLNSFIYILKHDYKLISMYVFTHPRTQCMQRSRFIYSSVCHKGTGEPLLRALCPGRDVPAPGALDMTLSVSESLLAFRAIRCPKLILHMSCLVPPISLFLVESWFPLARNSIW